MRRDSRRRFGAGGSSTGCRATDGRTGAGGAAAAGAGAGGVAAIGLGGSVGASGTFAFSGSTLMEGGPDGSRAIERVVGGSCAGVRATEEAGAGG